MALVSEIVHKPPLDVNTKYALVDCTFDVLVARDGEKHLQLDTYGSKARKLKGKKSQSIRLTPNALAQLRAIIAEHEL